MDSKTLESLRNKHEELTQAAIKKSRKALTTVPKGIKTEESLNKITITAPAVDGGKTTVTLAFGDGKITTSVYSYADGNCVRTGGNTSLCCLNGTTVRVVLSHDGQVVEYLTIENGDKVARFAYETGQGWSWELIN